MACNDCNNNCAASCDDVKNILEQTLYTMLQAGVLQAGLLSCEEGRLSQDSMVVLCSRLASLVQDGIDTGEITFPKAVSITSNGTIVTVTYDDGNTLTYDAKDLLAHVPIVNSVEYDELGYIVIGLSNGQTVKSAVSLKAFLTGIFRSCSGNAITPNDGVLTCQEFDTKNQAFSAEVKNYITEEFYATLHTVRIPVLTDMETLQGNGTDEDKIRINKIWLNKWLKDNWAYVDCDGEAITPGQALVSCVNLAEALIAFKESLILDVNAGMDSRTVTGIAYRDGNVTISLGNGTTYTADISAVDKHISSGLLQGRTITLTRNDGVTFDIDLSTFAVVTTGTVVTGTGTEADPIKFNLSAGAGNLLQVRADGLYYGIEAPDDLSNLFVDSLFGNDVNEGSYANPFKTYAKAQSLVKGNVNQTIWLHAGDDRPEYVSSHMAQMRSGRLVVRSYGDTYLDGAESARCWALMSPECPYYNGYRAVGLQRPRIRFGLNYVESLQIQQVRSLVILDGASIQYIGVKFMRGIRMDPMKVWALNANAMHYTASNGILLIENSIIFDDTSPEDTLMVIPQLIGASVSLGNCAIRWGDSVYEHPNRQGVTDLVALFSDLDSIQWYTTEATSECMGVDVISDNLAEFIYETIQDPNMIAHYISGIVYDRNWTVMTPKSNIALSPMLLPSTGTAGQVLKLGADGKPYWG